MAETSSGHGSDRPSSSRSFKITNTVWAFGGLTLKKRDRTKMKEISLSPGFKLWNVWERTRDQVIVGKTTVVCLCELLSDRR